ncbi:hypothetical protein IS481_12710 [Caldimonas thermodepolymerans]|jgi:hypothetical protein|uniref:Uncharacterized protein n=1 Tax=Caldimonas thermodepolymerans TaxID=215580 RepID=A0A2S5T9D5_9BURK|nr:hypothetical protein C1702_00935 [Caldimonas thermodepolymerans]QPC30618.1 hypothetical protein IS481_12710 [Caldimonas thermodepolymerans]RDI02777.1 hypothetical protein DES46_102204 [Caldimonas thermodepolymerans]
MKKTWVALGCAALALAMPVAAHSDKAGATVSEHVRKDIKRHRAMAAAHEAAARCLESGRSEEDCQQQLQAACKGLAIGKHCGMRHQH